MKKFWHTVFVAAISALFAFIGTYYLYSQQLEISKLDLHTSFDDSYFSNPKFPSSDITLLVDKTEKDKLGQVLITLVNFTTQNFKDIPIEIKITPENPQNFKVLAYSATGQEDVDSLVSKAKDMLFDGTSYHFSYVVSTLNRMENPAHGFQLRVLYEGTEEPSISVVPQGVGIRKYDIDNSPAQKSANIKTVWKLLGILVTSAILIFILSALVFNPVISIFIRKSEIKSHKKYAHELFISIKTKKLLQNKTDLEISNFVIDMLYQRQKSWWQDKSPFGKWTLGLIPPKRSDYEFEYPSPPQVDSQEVTDSKDKQSVTGDRE